MNITASDRSALIRLASSLPVGDENRRAILSSLSKAGIEFASKGALEHYMDLHPKSDRSKHTVKVQEDYNTRQQKKIEKKRETQQKKYDEKAKKEEGKKPSSKKDDGSTDTLRSIQNFNSSRGDY